MPFSGSWSSCSFVCRTEPNRKLMNTTYEYVHCLREVVDRQTDRQTDRQRQRERQTRSQLTLVRSVECRCQWWLVSLSQDSVCLAIRRYNTYIAHWVDRGGDSRDLWRYLWSHVHWISLDHTLHTHTHTRTRTHRRHSTGAYNITAPRTVNTCSWPLMSLAWFGCLTWDRTT